MIIMEGMGEAVQQKFSAGTCLRMCPDKEIKLRERENLLHKFEMKDGTENDRKPKADPDKVIKCYSRSAAGMDKIKSSDLRPFPVLMETIEYLYLNIFPLHSDKPITVYDFMFDRFRSIRQDMVVQNMSPIQTISILEPIARFHIFFGYFLINESEKVYDAFINNTHLQECLKRLLVCYDECERFEPSLMDYKLQNRSDIEGAYLLFNLTHFEALTRGVKLCNTIVNSKLLELSFAWYVKNFVRVFNLIKQLSPLMLCVISNHIPEIRKYSLQALAYGFSSANSSYPVSHLKNLLLYENNSEVISDCHHFSVKVTGDVVQFLKRDFNTSADLLNSRRLLWIDRQLLRCDLVKLLCYGSSQLIPN